MVSKSFLQAQLDKMKTVEKYTALLTMEKAQVVKKSGDGGNGEPPTKKTKEGEPSTSEQSPEEEDMVKSVVRFEDKVLGRKPTKRKAPFKGGKHTAEVFGLQNLSEVTELQEYLELNGNYHIKHVPRDGTCFWRSVLEQILYPAEYQYQMLKRQMVLTATEHPEFFFKALNFHIRSQYGIDRLTPEEYAQKVADKTITQQELDDQDSPGPFSFVGYLEYMLEPKTWGDHGTILILSLMWQVKVTIITAETQKQQRFHHDSSLKDADFVLVFCGGNHYVPAGEERSGAEIGPEGSGHQSLLELRSVLTALLCHFFMIPHFWSCTGSGVQQRSVPD